LFPFFPHPPPLPFVLASVNIHAVRTSVSSSEPLPFGLAFFSCRRRLTPFQTSTSQKDMPLSFPDPSRSIVIKPAWPSLLIGVRLFVVPPPRNSTRVSPSTEEKLRAFWQLLPDHLPLTLAPIASPPLQRCLSPVVSCE